MTPSPNRRRARRGVGAYTAGLALVLACASSAAGQSARPSDYDVKAAYLFNFGKFATWPAAAAPQSIAFTVCVVGRDPFGPTLDATLAGEKIDGKPVLARRIAKPQEAVGCRILFVSASEESQLQGILDVVDGGTGILTVSDMPEFAARGGMIQFVSLGNKVRFEVNLTAAVHAKVALSSELLKVATVVRRDAKPGE